MKKITLFDLDHTLLPIDSDYEWGAFTTRIGWTDPARFTAQNDQFYADYKRGTLDIAAYVRFATDAVRLRGEQASRLAHQQFMAQVIEPAITPQAKALVQKHQSAGDEVLIVTATNEFVTEPIAKAFGVDGLIALQLVGYCRDGAMHRSSGWITGEIQGVASVRAGKVERMAQWLAERGWSWDEVVLTFYSDSMNDLPLLEKVQEPVATNPDPTLRALALERGWRVLDLFENNK